MISKIDQVLMRLQAADPSLVKVGDSFNRANALRPVHKSIKRLNLYRTVFMILTGIAGYLSQFGNSSSAYYYSSFLFFAIGGLGVAALSVDCVLDWVRSKNTTELRKRTIAASIPSYRYEANPKHLRSFILGIIFWIIIIVFMLVVMVLRFNGIIGR